MDEFDRAISYLPLMIRGVLMKISPDIRKKTQEIRLRVDAPVTLSAHDGEWLVTLNGEAVTQDVGNLLYCTPADVKATFLNLCEHSVYAHQEELRNGYISTRSGCRAGIAGFSVVDNGQVISVRDISSICIRVARLHRDCAAPLAERLTEGQRVHSALICGEPASGKSSLLKDLARILSGVDRPPGNPMRRFRTAVVDERGELSFGGGLRGCDVLVNCPKDIGILQAIRCLAPDVVIFDELGSEKEAQAVTAALYCGVAAITTAHCRDVNALLHRSALLKALKGGAFDYIVMLKGRHAPGVVDRIISAADWAGRM